MRFGGCKNHTVIENIGSLSAMATPQVGSSMEQDIIDKIMRAVIFSSPDETSTQMPSDPESSVYSRSVA